MKRICFTVTVISLLSVTTSFAVSFDCGKAGTPIERAICSDRQLSELDSELMRSYKKALTISSNPDKLKTEQRSWLVRRDKCHNDIVCLTEAYNTRLKELNSVGGLPNSDQTLSEGAQGKRTRNLVGSSNQNLSGFTKDTLLNTNYDGWYNFKNGHAEDKEVDISVNIDKIYFADLNNDSIEDAILAYTMSSSHVFHGIVVIVNNKGKPVLVGNQQYERSEPIDNVVIKDGIITVHSKIRRPNEPMAAAPSVKVLYKYKVTGNKLIDLAKKKNNQ